MIEELSFDEKKKVEDTISKTDEAHTVDSYVTALHSDKITFHFDGSNRIFSQIPQSCLLCQIPIQKVVEGDLTE